MVRHKLVLVLYMCTKAPAPCTPQLLQQGIYPRFDLSRDSFGILCNGWPQAALPPSYVLVAQSAAHLGDPLVPRRYVKYTRWKPTSRAEAVAAEQRLLALCRCAACPCLRQLRA